MSNRTESYLVGLVGDGVMPSLTPPMHEREGDVQGLRYLYRPIDLVELGLPGDSVGELLRSARNLGFNGLNVTHPCKQLVLQHLDEVSPDAMRLGAVNTVVIDDGRFIGHNTDFSGFAAALSSGLPDAQLRAPGQPAPPPRPGGAGAAGPYPLHPPGAPHRPGVHMAAARGAARAAELAGFFPGSTVVARTTAELPQLMPLADGLVHCTPIGMAAHPGVPLDLELLESRHWVADIVYRPIDTELVRGARAKGCEVLDGGRMAVGQAADAFRIFTGLEPDPDRMRSHFLELVAAEGVAA
ncbi:shikimate dehydrogenase [Arthrobacter sp. AK04]|uniref:shikimate dehydrogenase n=1 Tax=Arthrobacter sp. AK04 TaxID=2900048 RepID=UPI001E5F8DDB|nr:shikimate dehydrogenase [Arthrobacter sp. AK04]MCD5341164.1 shikimate dehydrogenase [Arthrobacter sp. AK04]